MGEQHKSDIIDDLALIAHEFRIPIDIISKSAELVNKAQEKDSIEKDKLHVIMDGIIKNCHRMNLLTSQVICIAQAENNALKIIVEKNNVEQFFKKIEEYLAPFQKRYNVKFTFKVNFKEPYIVSDFKKIETILLNLISNAVKYSKDIDRHITVKCFDCEEGDFICFSVKDRGIGISEQEKEKIFSKFYRSERFNTRQTEGSGLGLAIVKKFVDILGGKISVESQPDKGSEFIVTIPRNQNKTLSPMKVVEAPLGYTTFKTSVEEVFAAIREV